MYIISIDDDDDGVDNYDDNNVANIESHTCFVEKSVKALKSVSLQGRNKQG